MNRHSLTWEIPSARIRGITLLLALASASLALACAAFAVQPAYALTVPELSEAYQTALGKYESAVNNQAQNADEIDAIERDIKEKDDALTASREMLAGTIKSLYKNSSGQGGLLELLLGSSSFYDAAMRLETYEKVENYYSERIDEMLAEQDALCEQKEQLEQRKLEIESEVSEAKQEVDRVQEALDDARHADGAEYHQAQGDPYNCGATAFTVSVNMLLHEERYPDNVEVWKGAGFEGDSITNLAGRAQTWVNANGLGNQISVEELREDIHKASELREQLELGNVVIISSGPGSVWQHADGTQIGPDVYPGGHWIVFYYYEDGTYFANDSAVGEKEGAGCPYTEEQLQQWLDGRGNHFATVVKTK